jgi:hypothetical protein
MRFEVKYISRKNFWDIFSAPTFGGKGYVYLQDTALVLDGNIPKFDVSFMLDIYSKVLFVPTTRTIPYSVIVKYKKPGLLRGNFHQITYCLPNGKKTSVWFRMTKPRRKQKDSTFLSRLEDYLKTAKSFVTS